jgi:hypothetical protein
VLGSENSQNLPLCKHALLSTWITILITLSLLLLLCRFKVHYFKFKFNPSKLARWLYTIVRCHMDEGWSKSDTGKVPNGHFLLFPIIHSWQTLQVWRQKRQLLIFQQKRQLTIINGGLSVGWILSIMALLGGSLVTIPLHIYLFIYLYLLFSVLMEPRFHAWSLWSLPTYLPTYLSTYLLMSSWRCTHTISWRSNMWVPSVPSFSNINFNQQT